jgi:adenosylmethionine---8-amino-7-oxononanoate aminotransferase
VTAQDFDRTHLWHPYSNVTKPGPIHIVASAEGVWLALDDGTRMIDAMSSWWSVIHGHRHPALMQAAHEQLDCLPHVMFGGLTHRPAIDLGKRLIAMLPSGLDRIFYSDSGSVAVEVAMKMAVQFQNSVGRPDRTQFATIRSGYHGDTWKAMSVCDPDTGMHHLFRGAVSVQHFANRPPLRFGEGWVDDDALNGIGDLRSLLAEHQDRTAALILEPVVQGAGGMYFYHPQYLNQARALCDDFGILLIFDEIATGFGRTGQMFATEFCSVTPDIMCLGKALTGGTMSFAATIATRSVADAIGHASPGAFMHGPTFMANPLACAVAGASLDLLAAGDWKARVAAIEAQFNADLAPLRGLPGVVDVRVLGAIGVIEMDHAISADIAHGYSRETGVYLRPFGRNIYAMPPFITTPDEMSQITAAMTRLATEM